MKEVRANEDDNTYSQRLETEKNRRSIEYLNETSDHYNDRMAKKRQKNKLMSKAINKEHKLASPAVTFQNQARIATRRAHSEAREAGFLVL